MKRILVTGASGFLGSSIIRSLQKLKYSVTTIGISGTEDLICNLANNVPSLASGYDWIIHAAGKAHVIPRNATEANDFMMVNFIGTKNLIMGIEASGSLPESVVFISSTAVYGMEKGDLITENCPKNPADVYGSSKLLAENFLLDWGIRNNVKIGIIRPPLIVGLNAPGNLGSIIRGIKSGYYLNIGNGKAKRSMVLADDLSAFLPEVAVRGGIYHLTDGHHPSFREISDVISHHFGNKKIHNIPPFLARILALSGDIGKSLLRREFPLDSARFRKMTSSLTFDDSKARLIGWNPRSVIQNPQLWLE